MERSEIVTTITELAVELLGVDESKVTEAARFKEDLDADSLDIVEFVMGMEEKLMLNFQKAKLKVLQLLDKLLTL